MSTKSMIAAAILGFGGVSVAQAATVTFSALNDSGAYLSLQSGIYTAQLIDGAFSAWSSGNRWLNIYSVDPDGDGTGLVFGDGVQYLTPEAAEAAAIAYTFSVPSDTSVKFWVADSVYSDNRGGPLVVEVLPYTPPAVPLPASALLLATGVAAFGATRSRRRAA